MCAISHESGDNLKKGVLYMYFIFKKVNDNLVTIDARTDNGEVKAKSFTNPTKPVDLGISVLFALNLGKAMDADLVEPEQLTFCYEQSYENVISVLTNAEYFIVRAGRFEPYEEEMSARKIALLEDEDTIKLNKMIYEDFFQEDVKDVLYGSDNAMYLFYKHNGSVYVAMM